MAQKTRGFGLAGECPRETAGAAASAAERAGYHTFWLSQPPGKDSLRTLAGLANATAAIRLGLGAIPFTLRTPEEIAEGVRDRGLPLDRLRLGVGSGTGPGSLARLREGVPALRSLLDVEVVVAPLGPKMCRLAGELADAVLLNWLTPDYASTSIAWIEDGAATAGRRRPTVCAYVRCALGAAAGPRLEAECARYRAFPHYAAHFGRQDVEPIRTAIHARSAAELQERLSTYEAILDQVVARAIMANDAVDEVLALVEAARPSA